MKVVVQESGIKKIIEEKKGDEGRFSSSLYTSSKTGLDSFKKALLCHKLDSIQNEEIRIIYSSLKKTKMWKLPSNRYVEEVMENFTQKLL